jgi:mRNA-degrading endonuclease RelE of RelBE toxin-antitoxin system
VNPWRVDLSISAQRELRRLNEGPRRAADELIDDLSEYGPELPGAIELVANPDIWRVRFHDGYRMVFEVSRKRRAIRIIRVRPRSIAYRGMKH